MFNTVKYTIKAKLCFHWNISETPMNYVATQKYYLDKAI